MYQQKVQTLHQKIASIHRQVHADDRAFRYMDCAPTELDPFVHLSQNISLTTLGCLAATDTTIQYNSETLATHILNFGIEPRPENNGEW